RWAMNHLQGALILSGCASSGPGAPRSETAPVAAPPAEQARPLVIYVRAEPSGVGWRQFKQSSALIRTSQRIFNALPALIDDRGVAQPELLASLPSLNTDSWRVFPDGTMQTTYTLRPNLTWHDGEPLTPSDFVFAWHVFATKELGQSSQQPIPSIS